MSKKYKNPPIVEALCEVQFVPGQPWDYTVHGLFYEKISKEFPEKQQQMGIGIKLSQVSGTIQHEVLPAPDKMQFISQDKAALVQVGTDLLVVNRLKPYNGWEHFKPLIQNNLNKFMEVAKPKDFKRIGLKYINKIDIPGQTFRLQDYFNYYPLIPKELPQTHGPFNARVEFLYENLRDRLLLTIGTFVAEAPNTVSILLDLDYVMNTPEKLPLNMFDSWLENAHSAIEKTFEACLTGKCKDLFEEMK